MDRSIPCAGLLLLGLLLTLPAWAQDSGWAYDLDNHLMSPYCPGRALSQCPSPQAAQLRQWIQAQEDSGRSRADVEKELFKIYGEHILQAPRAEGIGLVAYVIPILAFLIGGGFVALYLRRNRAGAPPAAPPAPPDPALERLVDQELEG